MDEKTLNVHSNFTASKDRSFQKGMTGQISMSTLVNEKEISLTANFNWLPSGTISISTLDLEAPGAKLNAY